MISLELNSISLMIFDMILEGIVRTLHSPISHRVIVKNFAPILIIKKKRNKESYSQTTTFRVFMVGRKLISAVTVTFFEDDGGSTASIYRSGR